jgi:acetyl esterase/lipase
MNSSVQPQDLSEPIGDNRRQFLKTALGAISGIILPFSISGTADAATTKNISYGPNRLDIYAPANPANAPVVAFVHGGAWRAGNRGRIGSKAKYYTSKGYVFVSIGYTLYPRANAERQALQVATAVNWIRKNIGKYGGDGGRIALMGHSAGCHLASIATLSGACTPKLLICNDTGAYDVAYLAKLNNGKVPSLYSALDKKSKWTRWSPISYVNNRQQPPALVMWSGGRNRDKISIRFANAMSAAGNSVTRFDGRRYNHLSINSAIGRSTGNSVTRAIDRFLTRL